MMVKVTIVQLAHIHAPVKQLASGIMLVSEVQVVAVLSLFMDMIFHTTQELSLLLAVLAVRVSVIQAEKVAMVETVTFMSTLVLSLL